MLAISWTLWSLKVYNNIFNRAFYMYLHRRTRVTVEQRISSGMARSSVSAQSTVGCWTIMHFNCNFNPSSTFSLTLSGLPSGFTHCHVFTEIEMLWTELHEPPAPFPFCFLSIILFHQTMCVTMMTNPATAFLQLLHIFSCFLSQRNV